MTLRIESRSWRDNDGRRPDREASSELTLSLVAALDSPCCDHDVIGVIDRNSRRPETPRSAGSYRRWRAAAGTTNGGVRRAMVGAQSAECARNVQGCHDGPCMHDAMRNPEGGWGGRSGRARTNQGPELGIDDAPQPSLGPARVRRSTSSRCNGCSVCDNLGIRSSKLGELCQASGMVAVTSGSVTSASAVLARELNVRVTDAVVPSECVGPAKRLFVGAHVAPHLLLARIVDRVLVPG